MQGLIENGRAPRVLAIENVEALLTSNKGADFTAICAELVGAGYNVGALVIDAALFVPQSRARVFVVAVRADMIVPPQLTQDGPTAPFHGNKLKAAVARLSPELRGAWRWWRLPTPPLRNVSLLDVLEIEARCDSDAETSRLLELMEPLHLAKVEEARRGGQRVVGAICRRMRQGQQRAEGRFDGVAQALRCPGGGSSIQRFLLIDANGLRSRKPTARECARLMGLPDSYKLPCSTQDAYQLTGDGVVSPAVGWLGEHLLAPLLEAAPYQAANLVAGHV
jgi:DNA (cytosine-5)-methyltransferase 1